MKIFQQLTDIYHWTAYPGRFVVFRYGRGDRSRHDPLPSKAGATPGGAYAIVSLDQLDRTELSPSFISKATSKPRMSWGGILDSCPGRYSEAY